MIDALLPEKVRVSERFDDVATSTLFPEEEAVISKAFAKRRQEFTTVRHCAREALAALDHPKVALVPGGNGAPQWPVDVVGSMTHCRGYRAAAVAYRRDVLSVGIDAEPNDALPDGARRIIARQEEHQAMRQWAKSAQDVCLDRLLFSAKESVYKAWHPLTERRLDFKDAVVDIDPPTGTFRAKILTTGCADWHPREFAGRWLMRDGLILTAVTRLTN